MLLRSGTDYGKILGAAFVAYIFAVAVGQLSFIADPRYLHEETRSLFLYHRFGDPDLFAGDYLTSFVSAFPQPHLYAGLTKFWLWLGGDLLMLHRLMTVICWLAFLSGMAFAARQIGGWVMVVGVVGIALVQPIYLHQITSATPHAFAFPLMAWGLAALLCGSTRGLMVVTLLSGLLYAATVPLLGVMLAWQVLVAQRLWSQSRRRQFWSLLLLALTGGLSLWLVFASLRGLEGFGAALAPLQRMEVYPENGPEGRHFFGVFSPLTYVLGKTVSQFKFSAALQSLFFMLVYAAFCLYGLFNLNKSERPRAVFIAFVVCAVAIWLAILLLKPFHSYRFVLYPAFTVMPLLFVAGLQQFMHRHEKTLRFPEVITLALLTVFVLAFDSFDEKKLGYSGNLGSEEQKIADFAAAQPQDSTLAIWPEVETPLEMIPYVARRPLFVMRKLHYPNYEGHLLTMRARMQALIDAYLAVEEEPLHSLHCRWGVDYLVVDKRHFDGEPGARPRYFAPFDAEIEERWQRHEASEFLLHNPDPAIVALETDAYVVLRLSALRQPGPEGDAGACEVSGGHR